MLMVLSVILTFYGVKWIIDKNNSPFKIITLSLLMAVIVNLLCIALIIAFTFAVKASGERLATSIGIMLVIIMPINLLVAIVYLFFRRKDFISNK